MLQVFQKECAPLTSSWDLLQALGDNSKSNQGLVWAYPRRHLSTACSVSVQTEQDDNQSLANRASVAGSPLNAFGK